MGDDQSVVSASRPLVISPKANEIDFGYHHVNESFIVYPGRRRLHKKFFDPICVIRH